MPKTVDPKSSDSRKKKTTNFEKDNTANNAEDGLRQTFQQGNAETSKRGKVKPSASSSQSTDEEMRQAGISGKTGIHLASNTRLDPETSTKQGKQFVWHISQTESKDKDEQQEGMVRKATDEVDAGGYSAFTSVESYKGVKLSDPKAVIKGLQVARSSWCRYKRKGDAVKAAEARAEVLLLAKRRHVFLRWAVFTDMKREDAGLTTKEVQDILKPLLDERRRGRLAYKSAQELGRKGLLKGQTEPAQAFEIEYQEHAAKLQRLNNRINRYQLAMAGAFYAEIPGFHPFETETGAVEPAKQRSSKTSTKTTRSRQETEVPESNDDLEMLQLAEAFQMSKKLDEIMDDPSFDLDALLETKTRSTTPDLAEYPTPSDEPLNYPEPSDFTAQPEPNIYSPQNHIRPNPGNHMGKEKSSFPGTSSPDRSGRRSNTPDRQATPPTRLSGSPRPTQFVRMRDVQMYSDEDE